MKLNAFRVAMAAAAFVSVTPAFAQSPAPAGDLDPRIQKLVAAISEERMQQLLAKLVAFETRNTFSDPSSTTRGIGAARQWIYDELKPMSPRLQVSFDTHTIPAGGRVPREVELRNIVAVLPGKTPRRIYVSGHYDTINLRARSQGGAGTAGSAQAPRPPADYNVVAPGPMTMGAGRCCRWSSRASSRRAASSSTRPSCSWRSPAKNTACSAPARTRNG